MKDWKAWSQVFLILLCYLCVYALQFAVVHAIWVLDVIHYTVLTATGWDLLQTLNLLVCIHLRHSDKKFMIVLVLIRSHQFSKFKMHVVFILLLPCLFRLDLWCYTIPVLIDVLNVTWVITVFWLSHLDAVSFALLWCFLFEEFFDSTFKFFNFIYLPTRCPKFTAAFALDLLSSFAICFWDFLTTASFFTVIIFTLNFVKRLLSFFLIEVTIMYGTFTGSNVSLSQGCSSSASKLWKWLTLLFTCPILCFICVCKSFLAGERVVVRVFFLVKL